MNCIEDNENSVICEREAKLVLVKSIEKKSISFAV